MRAGRYRGDREWYARKLERDNESRRLRRSRLPRCRFPGCDRYWKLYELGGCFEHEWLYVEHERIVKRIRAIPNRDILSPE